MGGKDEPDPSPTPPPLLSPLCNTSSPVLVPPAVLLLLLLPPPLGLAKGVPRQASPPICPVLTLGGVVVVLVVGTGVLAADLGFLVTDMPPPPSSSSSSPSG